MFKFRLWLAEGKHGDITRKGYNIAESFKTHGDLRPFFLMAHVEHDDLRNEHGDFPQLGNVLSSIPIK